MWSHKMSCLLHVRALFWRIIFRQIEWTDDKSHSFLPYSFFFCFLFFCSNEIRIKRTLTRWIAERAQKYAQQLTNKEHYMQFSNMHSSGPDVERQILEDSFMFMRTIDLHSPAWTQHFWTIAIISINCNKYNDKIQLGYKNGLHSTWFPWEKWNF